MNTVDVYGHEDEDAAQRVDSVRVNHSRLSLLPRRKQLNILASIVVRIKYVEAQELRLSQMTTPATVGPCGVFRTRLKSAMAANENCIE